MPVVVVALPVFRACAVTVAEGPRKPRKFCKTSHAIYFQHAALASTGCRSAVATAAAAAAAATAA